MAKKSKSQSSWKVMCVRVDQEMEDAILSVGDKLGFTSEEDGKVNYSHAMRIILDAGISALTDKDIDIAKIVRKNSFAEAISIVMKTINEAIDELKGRVKAHD